MKNSAMQTLLTTTCFLFLASCGEIHDNTPLAGVTEGGNTQAFVTTLHGQILLASGSPAVGAEVRLRDSAYLAPAPALAKKSLKRATTFTDSNGFYAMDSIESGSYRLTSRRKEGLVSSQLIHVNSAKDSTKIPVDTLLPSSSIRSFLPIALRDSSVTYVVRVPGTEIVQLVQGRSPEFVLEGLMNGDFEIRINAWNDEGASHVLTILNLEEDKEEVHAEEEWEEFEKGEDDEKSSSSSKMPDNPSSSSEENTQEESSSSQEDEVEESSSSS